MSLPLNMVRVSCPDSGASLTTLNIGGAVSAAFLSMQEAGAIDTAEYTFILGQGTDHEMFRATWNNTAATITITEMLYSKISGTAVQGSAAPKITLNGTAQLRVVFAAEDSISKQDIISNIIALG